LTLFPFLDLRFAGFPVAIIRLPTGQWDIRKIKLVHDKFFFIKFNKYSGGLYELDATKKMPYRKTAMYLFDSFSGKPIDIKVMKDLHHFAKKNSLARITQKDVRHGSRLRQVMTEVTDRVEAVKKMIDEHTPLQMNINQKMKESVDSAKPQEIIEFKLIRELVEGKLISEDEAIYLTEQVEKKELDFEQLIERLQQIEVFNIQHPISAEAQLFLEEFHNYRPAEVYQYIQLAKNADKKFNNMGSGAVKNAYPIGMILMMMMIGIIGIAVLGQADLSNFNLPSPPSFLDFSGEG